MLRAETSGFHVYSREFETSDVLRCGHGHWWISVLKRLRLHEHGTREIGSSNLRSLIEKHSARIRANAFCLFNILLDLTMKIDRGS